MDTTTEIGKQGETIAKEYLISKGYKILHINWHYKHKEIDIVCEKDDTLVVVEVKTRTSSYFENPQDSITKKKQRFIIEATNAYIEKYNIDFETRFDAVGIIYTDDKYTIEHIEDAFTPIVRRF